MKEIFHCFWVNAPLELVHAAVTEKEGLSGWWTRDVDVQGTVGSISTFGFKSGAYNRMKVKAIDLNKVEWECVEGDQEWIGTRVSFQLRAEGQQTKVCFSHYGWKEQSEYVGECSFHWAKYLSSLQEYCETGRGRPNEGRG